jgi:hypothetical protein
MYATCKPAVHPTRLVHLDLFVLYVINLITAALDLVVYRYHNYVYGEPMPSTIGAVAAGLNIAAIAILLLVVVFMPMGVPSNHVKKENIVRAFPRIRRIFADSLEGKDRLSRRLYDALGMDLL